MDFLAMISPNVRVDWWSWRMFPVGDETYWANKDIKLRLRDNGITALTAFFDQAWFSRLWIWQEVRLAPDRVLVVCGSRTISWTDLQTAVYCIHNKLAPSQGYLNESLRSVYSLCNGNSCPPFPILLEQTSHAQCTDPRDRVFALLSMLNRYDPVASIKADYNKDIVGVYSEAAVRFMVYSRHLNILTNIDASRRLPDAPSWVPNWSQPQLTNPFGGYASCGALAVHTDHLAGKLIVSGVQVATIAGAAPFDSRSFTVSTTPNDILSELRRAIKSPLFASILKDRHMAIPMLCRVMCSNKFAHRQRPQNTWKLDMGSCQEFLNHVLFEKEHTTALSSEEIKILDAMTIYCQDRALTKTTDGALTLTPSLTRAGDIVTVLLGCRSTMILRPRPASTEFEIIGEAYTDGFMEGEGLLGPFPPGFEPVHGFDDDVRQPWRKTMDWNTGELHQEDPRLPDSLPSGWERRPHAYDKVDISFVNTTTGEVREGGMDPRLNEENLIAMGVPIQRFTLV
ncbi:hypothetical protein F4808DRAFT_429912 [Astrocystis sublimbata]|nr:hypothetical protein F4808DRAFT_429912 [Astrocystis sublimbata]